MNDPVRMPKPTNTPHWIIIHTAAFRKPATIVQIDSWHKEVGFTRKPEWVRFHQGSLGYVGYHYYIRKNGEVYYGRHELEQGAHCRNLGMNRKSIGICFEGHGNFEPFTTPQIQRLKAVVRRLHIRYPSIRQGGAHRIMGHRETGARKECPGLLIDMDEIRLTCSEAFELKPLVHMTFESDEPVLPDTLTLPYESPVLPLFRQQGEAVNESRGT